MMKTPDDIKKGLEYLSIKDVARKLDAWEDGIPYDCVEDAAADALACIQQLEADNAQQARCIENLTDKLNAMNDEVAKLQAERDAAVDDLKKAANAIGECFGCKWYNGKICTSKDYKPICSSHDDKWEWRGVQKEVPW